MFGAEEIHNALVCVEEVCNSGPWSDLVICVKQKSERSPVDVSLCAKKCQSP